MTMIMVLDSLAERYGLLPSEVISRATTFDLFILDAAMGYRTLLQERANNGNKPVAPKLSTDEMKAMVERVRSKYASQ